MLMRVGWRPAAKPARATTTQVFGRFANADVRAPRGWLVSETPRCGGRGGRQCARVAIITRVAVVPRTSHVPGRGAR